MPIIIIVLTSGKKLSKNFHKIIDSRYFFQSQTRLYERLQFSTGGKKKSFLHIQLWKKQHKIEISLSISFRLVLIIKKLHIIGILVIRHKLLTKNSINAQKIRISFQSIHQSLPTFISSDTKSTFSRNFSNNENVN